MPSPAAAVAGRVRRVRDVAGKGGPAQSLPGLAGSCRARLKDKKSHPKDRRFPSRYMLEFCAKQAHPLAMTLRLSPSFRMRLSAWAVRHAVLLGILGVCTLVEAVLQGTDFGLWGSPRWRGLAYQNGGFWRGLLDNWRPNYAVQPAAMFASYGFLHGGFFHLAVNMITLASLGPPVIERVGQWR